MDKLIELLQQIQELAGVGIDALKGAGGGEGGGARGWPAARGRRGPERWPAAEGGSAAGSGGGPPPEEQP